MATLTNFAARDVEALLHPTTNLATHRTTGPLIIDKGKGVHVWDTDGKRYIEGLAGLWCTSLGYGNTELIEAAREQMEKLSFTHLFGGRSHEPAIQLAEKLKEIVPSPTSKIFLTSSGSEANDSQIKLSWYYNNARGLPKKKKIISRQRAYHGVTIASASLTGLPVFHSDFDLPMARVLHTSSPHYYRNGAPGETEDEFCDRLVRDLEELILAEDPDTIAAFIAEPIMGAGGVVVPPKGYFPKMQAVLSRYDIRMIADEVICGFGRTGNMWGSQTLDIKPDSISMAKAITSAYMPLGAITVSEPVYEALVEESKKIGMFAHGFTYSGHPVAAAVAVKTLEIYERLDIVGHVQKVAPIFQARMAALRDHPLVGETRGAGLIGGIELVRDKHSHTPFDIKKGVGTKAMTIAQQNGLICRAVAGDTIALCPPLVVQPDDINEMFDILGRALDQTQDWLTREGADV
ncbi:MAG: aminotransferase [Hyphomicrobiaceae bacterium]